MVTVVDALNIFEVLSSMETLAEENSTGMGGRDSMQENKKESEGDLPQEGEDGEDQQDDRSIANLMLDQIEFANVIVLSKVGNLLGTSSEKNQGIRKVEEITALLKRLNPGASIVVPKEDKFADLDTDRWLINTNLFDMEKASRSAGWLQELDIGTNHVPETEEYGISSVVFRARDMPFHPQRLDNILEGFGNYASAVNASAAMVSGASRSEQYSKQVFKGVVRAKGLIWLANAYAYPMELHVAGIQLEVTPRNEPFLAAIPEDEWTDDDKKTKDKLVIENKWTAEHGDRHSELVFIGVNLNKSLIESALNDALLTKEESKELGGLEGWQGLEDPFFEGKITERYWEAESEEEESQADEHEHCVM